MTKQNLIGKLLRKNISTAQIAGYALANFVGLTIIMTALQFYFDADSVINGEDKLVSADYIIISKKITPLGYGDYSLTQSEIDDIKSQPWVSDVAAFSLSQFNINASVDMAGKGMATALFFEAVPDRFLDISPATWTYKIGSTDVPIILPKDYLSLYNFGFASSHGLPTVSEEMIGLIPIRLSLSGNGKQQYFTGHIVGFSSRLNTIAVPETFLNYANGIFASAAPSPTRVIVKVITPGDPAIEKYISENGYDTGNGNNDNSKVNFFLTIITSIVIAIGAIITLLSLFILLLSLHLLLQKNRGKIHNLMLLGVKPRQISKTYHKMVIYTNFTVFILATAVTTTAAHFWGMHLSEIGFTPQSETITIITGLLIIFAVSLINFVTINREVNRSF